MINIWNFFKAVTDTAFLFYCSTPQHPFRLIPKDCNFWWSTWIKPTGIFPFISKRQACLFPCFRSRKFWLRYSKKCLWTIMQISVPENRKTLSRHQCIPYMPYFLEHILHLVKILVFFSRTGQKYIMDFTFHIFMCYFDHQYNKFMRLSRYCLRQIFHMLYMFPSNLKSYWQLKFWKVWSDLVHRVHLFISSSLSPFFLQAMRPKMVVSMILTGSITWRTT